jgi:hypothetical protein
MENPAWNPRQSACGKKGKYQLNKVGNKGSDLMLKNVTKVGPNADALMKSYRNILVGENQSSKLTKKKNFTKREFQTIDGVKIPNYNQTNMAYDDSPMQGQKIWPNQSQSKLSNQINYINKNAASKVPFGYEETMGPANPEQGNGQTKLNFNSEKNYKISGSSHQKISWENFPLASTKPVKSSYKLYTTVNNNFNQSPERARGKLSRAEGSSIHNNY